MKTKTKPEPKKASKKSAKDDVKVKAKKAAPAPEKKAKAKPDAKAKVDKKAAKPAAKDKKDMTPLEKARLARANGTASKSKKSAKKLPPIFKAPEDFKPHFLEVMVKTEKDGLLSNAIKATRFVGRYDPQAPDKKKIDLGGYDRATLQGVLSRLSMTTYATNAARRLPPNTTYKILLRVNRKAKDGSLSIGFKMVAVGVKSAKTGRVKAVELDKKDPQYRMFRKSNRILPGAFKNVLMPPKRTRGVKVAKEADDE